MGIVSDVLSALEVPVDAVEQIGPTLDRLGLAQHITDFMRSHVALAQRVAALEGQVNDVVQKLATNVTNDAAPADAVAATPAPAPAPVDPRDALIAQLQAQIAALMASSAAPAAPAADAPAAGA